MNLKNVSVIGLGKLGLPYAVCLAKRGFQVIGVDIDKRKIELLNQKIPPFFEPNLKEYLEEFGENLYPTNSYEKAIRESDISFVIVATPTDKNGNFSNSYVEGALKSLSIELKKINKKYHLFVINSTVMPGSTEERFIKIIERYSGKKKNKDFGLCYVPDFVALGKAIKDFLNPDFVLIGESNKFAGEMVEKIYKKLCENNPSIYRTSIISAEIAKMCLNVFITLKITFANILGNICERIPNSDVDMITKTIGTDKRISPYYLKAGLSFGGTCFPRDVKALDVFLRKLNYPRWLTTALNKINKLQDDRLFEITRKWIKKIKAKKIAILGLSFKPNTPVIEASPAITLIKNLLKEKLKIRITVYDPLATENTKLLFGEKLDYASSLGECFKESDLVLVCNPDEKYKEIKNSWMKNEIVIIDCWRILDSLEFKKKIKYVPIGKHYKT